MAGEIENFGDKAGSNSLAHRPQDINKNGRPKSHIRKIYDLLVAEGHEPASRSDIESTYVLLTGLTVQSLETLRDDEENPVLIRTVANALIKGWNNSTLNLEYILSRGIGAPKGNGEQPSMLIDNANILVVLPPIAKE